MRRVLPLLILGCCAFGGSFVAAQLAPRLQTPVAAQPQPVPARLAAEQAVQIGHLFEAVASRLSPAVVAVEASKDATSSNGKSRSIEESGSGVIIRWPGQSSYLVLTNNHVVDKARPEQITVHLADGRLLHPGQVWTDPESDIAVLRLDGQTSLPYAVLGDSDRMRVGQWVLAIGSPFGLNQSVTHGIISARERGQVSLGSTIRIKDFLQTDAAINPGSSGGPLVNLDGEVIGINTAIASQNGSNSGVAFSIPVNLVKRVLRQLLEKGTVTRGYLGLQLAGTFDPAEAFKIGLDRVQGALVETVFPETPAAQAGLKARDVVLRVDDTTIRNENHLINLISQLSVGQRIRLHVWRERRELTLEAVIGDWNKAQARFKSE